MRKSAIKKQPPKHWKNQNTLYFEKARKLTVDKHSFASAFKYYPIINLY